MLKTGHPPISGTQQRHVRGQMLCRRSKTEARQKEAIGLRVERARQRRERRFIASIAHGADNAQSINAAIAKVKEASSRNDLAAIKAATAELEQASQAMAQHMYSKVGGEGQGAAPSQGPEGKKDGPDDVIDAEYEVKK